MTQNEESGFLSDRKAPQEKPSLAPWILAGAVVVVMAAVLVIAGLRSKSGAAGSGGAPDAYAAQLTISNVTLSQSSNMAGSQITYVDGDVANNGTSTVVGITVQTSFLDNAGKPGAAEVSSLSLIRTRDPYVDIQPVSAKPLQPGQTKPFRLIFDQVPADWNQQPPRIRIQHVELR